MAKIEIVTTTPEHVLALRETLREEDASEICKLGLPIRKALYRSFKDSLFSRTALVDGMVAACWGLRGVLLGEVGNPWLLTGRACENVHPVTFAQIYRGEVQEMLKHFSILENWVDSDYTKSVRLLKLVGFRLDDPMPIEWLKTGALFRRFEMRASDV